MGDDTEGGNEINEARTGPTFEESNDWREAGQNEEQTNDDRYDETDNLRAGHRGSDAADGQICAGHQPTSDIAAKDDAVIGAAEIIDGDDDGKSQHQSQEEENPGGEEFADDGLPRGDRHGQKKFDGADAAFFRPESHADGRHEKQIKPGMPNEKRPDQGGLIDFEKAPNKKGEKAAEEEEDHDEDVSERGREISRQLTFRDGFDICECVHGDGDW